MSRGLGDVYKRQVKDEKTKLTSTEEVIVLEDEPCRLSYSNVSTTDQTESVAKTSQIIKLFMSPETKIKPGAKITVTQAGVTETYECSGTPAVYETHQEIILKLAGRYA